MSTIFKVLKQSNRSRARIGILKTPHGEIETPCLIPVATQAVVKTLTSEEAVAAKCQALIANTLHLHPAQILQWVTNELLEDKSRHLLGVGHPGDIPIIKTSINTFACTVPAHYTRHNLTNNTD